MVRWQKRARWGLAAFGIVFAMIVYAAIGTRQDAGPPAAPSRLDPRAILESAGAAFQQFQATRQDYVIEAERQLTYEGGATKFIGVTITVRQRGGRDFVVSGREAEADDDRKALRISGDVTLAASDGFVARADRATFHQDDATVRVDGQVSFEKGRMTGSGVGMTYDQDNDVLTLAQEARVLVADGQGQAVHEFSSGAATLARQEHYLALERDVHARRANQVLEADSGRALLTDDNEQITFIELRGNARVSGGTGFEGMTAREIDLDYADDGAAMERVALRGDGAVTLTSDDAEGATEGGRRFAGQSLDLAFAPDASLTRAAGRGAVRVDLPADATQPVRTVTADAFEATGAAGRDLTAAEFQRQVEYREGALPGRSARVVRSGTLRLALEGQAVTGAAFGGGVRFEEQGLRASGGEGVYDPAQGTLRLTGTDAGRGPRVADADIEIEATAIDIVLESRHMSARGNVQAILNGGRGSRLPGLFADGRPANVSSAALEYHGDSRRAVFTGNATLWQGETAIRADSLTLDQERADLLASGNARSNLVFETGASIGRAAQIRYDDAARTVHYVGTTVPVAAPAQVSGPQGDLRAQRIEVLVGSGSDSGSASSVERLEAYTDVSMRLDMRLATGDRLTYFADEERYVITGVPTVPVRILEECRETVGRTVTFFKASERIIVDGNEEVRTQSRRGGPCPAPAAP